MKKSVSNIKIFVGHSTKEFSNEIGNIVSFLNGTLSELFNVEIDTFVCEQKIASSQDEINYYIANETDLALFCFMQNAGKYTLEEYQVALDTYKSTEYSHPKIAVYFKNGEDGTSEVKKSIENDRIYYTEFETIDAIKLDALLILKGLSSETFNFEFNEDGLYINQKKIKNIYLDQLPIYKNNKDINQIEKELNELSEKAELLLSNSKIEEFKEVANKINDLTLQKSIKRKAILEFCEKSVNSMLENNESDLMRLARKCATKGLIDEALMLLPKVEQIKAESDLLLADIDNKREKLKEKANILLDIINLNTLKNINGARKQLNDCGEQLIKLLPELKDFTLIEKFCNYCLDSVISIDIRDFLIDLLDEKFIKSENKNYLFILNILSKYENDNSYLNDYFDRLLNGYIALLDEKDFEKNFEAERTSFDLIYKSFFWANNKNLLNNILSKRIHYLNDCLAKSDDIKIQSELIISKISLVGFNSDTDGIEESIDWLTKFSNGVFNVVNSFVADPSRILLVFAQTIILVKAYNLYEITAKYLKDYALKYKDIQDFKKQEIAIDLFSSFARICSELGKANEASFAYSEIGKLLARVMNFNDVRFLPIFINYSYFNITNNIKNFAIDTLTNDLKELIEIENNLESSDLARNCAQILQNKIALISKFFETSDFKRGLMLCESGISLAKKSKLPNSSIGFFLFMLHSDCVGHYCYINDLENATREAKEVVNLLKDKNEFIVNDVTKKVASVYLESFIPYFNITNKSISLELSNHLNELKGIQNKEQATRIDLELEFNEKARFTTIELFNFAKGSSNKEKIIDLYSNACQAIKNVGRNNLEVYSSLSSIFNNLTVEVYKIINYKELQFVYDNYIELFGFLKTLNKFSYFQSLISYEISIYSGLVQSENKDLDAMKCSQDRISKIYKEASLETFDNKTNLLFSILNTLLALGNISKFEEVKAYALLYKDEIENIKFTNDNNGLIQRMTLNMFYFSTKNDIPIKTAQQALKSFVGTELTEEKFLELVREYQLKN